MLSGPTQLSFVNKKKSSAYRKEQQPAMFHRFRDLGFGFFADAVREYSGAGAGDADVDDGLGSGSSSAVCDKCNRIAVTFAETYPECGIGTA